MKPRHLLIAAVLALIAALIWQLPKALEPPPLTPGLEGTERTLLRIWLIGNADGSVIPGGSQAWLTQQLRAFEKQHPGVMTHLRIVQAEEVSSPDAVLPDVILFSPGDFTEPAGLFVPLTADAAIREDLLRCGRWQGQQLSVPLCWGAWVLAIDSAIEPGSATTPAPTTLLGRPAATAAPSAAPGYPLAAVDAAACPLQSPGGTALLSLQALLPEERPRLPEDFAQLSPAEVYAAFQARKCATAMLTTGQATAFTSLVSAGKGFPFRIITPDTVVTDQVFLLGLTSDAPEAAHELLAFLTGPEAQQALASQGLHTVRDDLTLYAAGFSAEVEAAGQRSLSAVNAWLPAEVTDSAAWQAFQGRIGYTEALLPLL